MAAADAAPNAVAASALRGVPATALAPQNRPGAYTPKHLAEKISVADRLTDPALTRSFLAGSKVQPVEADLDRLRGA